MFNFINYVLTLSFCKGDPTIAKISLLILVFLTYMASVALFCFLMVNDPKTLFLALLVGGVFAIKPVYEEWKKEQNDE